MSLGERSYAITIGAGLLDRADELLPPLLPLRRTVLVTDENLAAPRTRAGWRPRWSGRHRRAARVVLPPGEGTKSWRSSSGWSTTSGHGVERRSV